MKSYERITSPKIGVNEAITLHQGRRVFPDDYAMYSAAARLHGLENAIETLAHAIDNLPDRMGEIKARYISPQWAYEKGLKDALRLFTSKETEE